MIRTLRRTSYLSRVVVRDGARLDIVPVQHIDWIEAAGDFACLHVGAHSHVLSHSLRGLEARLDPVRFLRIHRSRIVNVDRVRQLHKLFHGEYLLVLADGARLTSGRHYTQRVKEFFSNDTVE